MSVLMYKDSRLYLDIHFIVADKKQERSKNEMKKKNQLIMQRRIVSSGMVMRLNDATYSQILSEIAFF